MPAPPFLSLLRKPYTWIWIAFIVLVQLLIIRLFAFSFSPPLLLHIPALVAILITAGVAGSAYFAPKPTGRRATGLLLLMLCLLYIQFSLQPENRYGVRPLTEVRGALNAAVNYEALPQQLLNQKPGPPYALRTALLHRYRDEMPQRSWLISFSGKARADTRSLSTAPQEDTFNRFYLFNLRNEQIGSNHPNMLNARLQANPSRLILDIAHPGGDFRYEIPLYYARPQPIIVSGRAVSDSSLESSAKVYIHLTDAGQHSGFQQLYYRFLNVVYGPGSIT